MEKTAFIWRKSVYTNDFTCNKCAAQLADSEGRIQNGKTVLTEKYGKPFIHCRRCGNPVAYIQKMNAPKEMYGLQGEIGKFKKGRKKKKK